MNNSNNTSPAHSMAAAVVGGSSGGSADEFHFPSDFMIIQDRKEETMHVLKTELMAALNREVRSIDEDNWKFEGPRSRIHLISKPGGFLKKKIEMAKERNLPRSK